ncbi:hypothetical protein [Chryseobacterium indoltheticum]|uniref:hypothetical protein n=1 Tax=Chryseobacterium indoltheticum TaxID=254 RepID=UPI0028E538AE|nr:hypothetical protein [Chryseobacterium indoltheticum]
MNVITLYAFIFINNPEDKKNRVLINHEKIHIRQQLELLIIFFYILYVAEYYYHFFRLKNAHAAYHAISFEREAYSMEHDLNYLKKRKFWAFRKYF